MSKKILSIILSVMLVAGLLPMIGASASTEDDQVFTYGGITYKVLTESDAETETTGTVQVGDGVGAAVPADTQGTVTIPSTVLFNGAAFSVTNIGDWAFCGCKALECIVIPSTVSMIDYYAFAECPALSALYFDGDAPEIGESPFVEAVAAVEEVSSIAVDITTLEHLVAVKETVTKMTEVSIAIQELAHKADAVSQVAQEAVSVAKLSSSAKEAAQAILRVSEIESNSKTFSRIVSETEILSQKAQTAIEKDALSKLGSLEERAGTLSLCNDDALELAQLAQKTYEELLQRIGAPDTQSDFMQAIKGKGAVLTEFASAAGSLAAKTAALSIEAKTQSSNDALSQLATKTAELKHLASTSDKVSKIANDTAALKESVQEAKEKLKELEFEVDRITRMANHEDLLLKGVSDALQHIWEATDKLSKDAKDIVDRELMSKFKEMDTGKEKLLSIEEETKELAQKAQHAFEELTGKVGATEQKSKLMDEIEKAPTNTKTLESFAKALAKETDDVTKFALQPSFLDMIPELAEKRTLLPRLIPISDGISKIASDTIELKKKALLAHPHFSDLELFANSLEELTGGEVALLETLSVALERIATDTDSVSNMAEEVSNDDVLGNIVSLPSGTDPFTHAQAEAEKLAEAAQLIVEEIGKLEGTSVRLSQFVKSAADLSKIPLAAADGRAKSLGVAEKMFQLKTRTETVLSLAKSPDIAGELHKLTIKTMPVSRLDPVSVLLLKLESERESLRQPADLAYDSLSGFESDMLDLSELAQGAIGELTLLSEESEGTLSLDEQEQVWTVKLGLQELVEAVDQTPMTIKPAHLAIQELATRPHGLDKLGQLAGMASEMSKKTEAIKEGIKNSGTVNEAMSKFADHTDTLKELIESARDGQAKTVSISETLKEVVKTAADVRKHAGTAKTVSVEISDSDTISGNLKGLAENVSAVAEHRATTVKEIKNSGTVHEVMSGFGADTNSLGQMFEEASGGRTRIAGISDTIGKIKIMAEDAGARAISALSAADEISDTVSNSDELSELAEQVSGVSVLLGSEIIEEFGIAVGAVSQVETAIAEVLPIATGAEAYVYYKAEGFPEEGQQWNGLTVVIRPYLVTFVDWDGAVLGEQEVYHGNAADAPDNPKRFDHYFIGWDADYSFIADNLTVTAQYVGWAMTDKSDAFGTKISSNSQSFNAGSGVIFYWSPKQKDECVLVIDPEFFNAYQSLTIVVNASNEYRIVTIPVSGTFEVNKWLGDKSINSCFIRFNG